MNVLNIALLGVPGSGVGELAIALNEALFSSSRWPQMQIFENPPLPLGASCFALVLLMGLPHSPALCLQPAGLATPHAARQSEKQQQADDLSIRKALAESKLAYQVLYGTPGERLMHSLEAIESLLPQIKNRSGKNAAGSGSDDGSGRTMTRSWVWLCDKCSDPACEQKLLTDLLNQRASTA